MSIFGGKKKTTEESVDPKKVKYLKRGKELGLNLESSMSEYELQHRISEAEEELKKKELEEKKKNEVKSQKRGEY